MDTIDIALAADGGYFCGLFVTACSIAKYASPGARLRFDILDGGLSEGDWALLRDKVAAFHADTEFRRLEVNGAAFKDCLSWHGNHMTYARLLLPDLLPDADYCVYCDVDFLWMRDIVELWHERRENIALISTWDGAKSTWDVDGGWMKARGFDFSPDDYFCAGLTFFNLKYFREHDLSRRCLELLALKPPFNDQTVLYLATKGKTKLVPLCWQRIHQYVTPAMVAEGAVIHYAGAVPWKPSKRKIFLLRDIDLLWYRMNAEARGISLWRSLRTHFSAGYIFWHRGLCLAVRAAKRAGLATPLRIAFSRAGHPGVWAYLDRASERCRRVAAPAHNA